MREKRLDIATNLNYASGPTVGQPTKIAPPLSVSTDGARPGDAFGAQWMNYILSNYQKQIEISAQNPFRNWQEITGVGSSSLHGGSTGSRRFAFNETLGATIASRGQNNTVYYLPELPLTSAGTPLTTTFTPASGTFVPKDVAAINDPNSPGWIVVGSNSTSNKGTWRVGLTLTKTEDASLVAGSVELICKDATTGYFYAFAADTNRSVLVRGPLWGDTWSVYGTRGAGAPAPTNGMFCAAANGLLLLAYNTSPGSMQVTVERIPTPTAPTPLQVAYTPFSDTSALLDVIYSPQMNRFMVRTTAKTHRFSDPTAGVESVTHPFLTGTPPAGCLHSTGSVIVDGHGLGLSTWFGDPVRRIMFGDVTVVPSTAHHVRFDGSALWFVKDESGTPRLFRSLRSN